MPVNGLVIHEKGLLVSSMITLVRRCEHWIEVAVIRQMVRMACLWYKRRDLLDLEMGVVRTRHCWKACSC